MLSAEKQFAYNYMHELHYHVKDNVEVKPVWTISVTSSMRGEISGLNPILLNAGNNIASVLNQNLSMAYLKIFASGVR